MAPRIASTAHCVQGASWTCQFLDNGVSPWFVIGGGVVFVGLALFLNWTRSRR